MERRRAVIAAATASLTLLAGAAAISLNTALVGASGDDGVGRITPVDPAAVVIDDPATAPATPDQGRSYADDHDGRADDEVEDADESDLGDRARDEDHGDDAQAREYEGADDDD